MVLIVGLILVGIILLVLEVLVLPGMVAGVMGCVFMIGGIIWMYSYEGATIGNITLLSVIVLTSVTMYMALKSRSWKRFGLKETIDGRVNDISAMTISEGDEGVTLSALRPSGTVLMGNQRVEAQTNGEMIDAGTKVVVVRVYPNKILVSIKKVEL